MSNALENFLPNYSSDSPESLDIYTIMSDIRSRGDLLGYSDADLTAPERAFIASHVAMKNELDIQSQLNTVKFIEEEYSLIHKSSFILCSSNTMLFL